MQNNMEDEQENEAIFFKWGFEKTDCAIDY